MELENKKTYLGYVSGIRKSGTLALVRIIAEKNNGQFQFLEENETEVFVTKPDSYNINDLYEIKEITENRQTGEGYKASWISKNVIPASRIPVFKYQKKKNFMDLEKISAVPEICITRDIPKFILQDSDNPNIFYGYFKKINGKVEAKEHKHAHVYVLTDSWKHLFELNNNKMFFLNDDLGEPKSKIDCASIDQLMNWLKEKTKTAANLKKSDIDLLKLIMRQNAAIDDDLEKVRFERVKNAVSGTFKNFCDIQSAINNKESALFEAFHQELDKYKESLKIDIQRKFDMEMATKRQEILSSYEEERRDKEKDVENLDEEIKRKTNSLETVKQNYNSILETLKLALSETQFSMNSKIQSKAFSPIVFSCENKAELDDENSVVRTYVSNLKDSVEESSLPKILKKIKPLLTTNRACFVPCVMWAYVYAIAVQRSRVWTLHVEHDWLHYEDYCKNGLIEIWKYAHSHPEENCVMILDSINLTQTECGLNPLLDVINGKAPILLGTGLMYPANLKIFATIVPSGEEDMPGLKMLENSFACWDYFGSPNDSLSTPSLSSHFIENKGDKKYIPIKKIQEFLKQQTIDENQKNLYLG